MTDTTTTTLPTDVVVRAYGALSAAAHHLRNLPATEESDDARVAKLAQDAFDAITEATIPDDRPAPPSPSDQARALLAQALANNPIDRKLIERAYALLKGLGTT